MKGINYSYRLFNNSSIFKIRPEQLHFCLFSLPGELAGKEKEGFECVTILFLVVLRYPVITAFLGLNG
jgi:hypothetical protein